MIEARATDVPVLRRVVRLEQFDEVRNVEVCVVISVAPPTVMSYRQVHTRRAEINRKKHETTNNF